MDGSADRTAAQDTAAPDAPSAPESADPWRDFLTGRSGGAFLAGWLAIAAGRVAGCRAGAVFMRGAGGRLGLAATWQMGARGGEEMARLAGAALERAEPVLDSGAAEVLLAYPVDAEGQVQAILVLALAAAPSDLRLLLRELHWSAGWIEARLWQGRSAQGRRQAESARLVLDLLAATDSHERFDGAALALVNAVPELTGFDRAALGMVRRGRVRLEALSRAAAFKRRADLVSAYEAAMEEARAQDGAVALPARPDGRRMVDLAHRALAARLGSGVVVSAPLIVRGRTVGVLMLERAQNAESGLALDAEALDDIRLAAAALGPLLKAKLDERRLVSGRGRALLGRASTAVLGRRPAIAAGVLAGLLVLAVPLLVRTELRVRADATVQGATQQVAVAPVDGFLAVALVRAGMQVAAGQVLARLDDRDLRLQLASDEARAAEARQALREALAGGDRAAAAVANAELAEAAATLELTRARLSRLEIVAPIAGLVVRGDLSQRIGAPVTRGEELFEIAELEGWRLRIDVSEYDLGLLAPGQVGAAVFLGLAGQAIPFEVTAIAAVSEPAEGQNRFRVEARVTAPPEALRPGLTGTAKIDTGPTRLAWAWARGTMARARIFLWRLLP